jgi:hypothetical protein
MYNHLFRRVRSAQAIGLFPQPVAWCSIGEGFAGQGKEDDMLEARELRNIALFLISPDDTRTRELAPAPEVSRRPACRPERRACRLSPEEQRHARNAGCRALAWMERRAATLGACKTLLWVVISVAAGCGLGQLQ